MGSKQERHARDYDVEAVHVGEANMLEMNVESYRRAAINRKRGPGRPPAHTTIKETA